MGFFYPCLSFLLIDSSLALGLSKSEQRGEHFFRFSSSSGYLGQFDDFSAAQTELLVVVKNSVHVLDPDGVNGTVEHVPLLIHVLR